MVPDIQLKEDDGLGGGHDEARLSLCVIGYSSASYRTQIQVFNSLE